MDPWHNAAQTKKPWLTPIKIVLIACFLLLLLVAGFLITLITANPTIGINYGAKANELARTRQNMPADAPDNWGLISEIAAKLEAARTVVAARHPDLPIDTFDFTFLYSPDAKPSRDTFTADQARAVCLEWLEEFRAAGGFDELAKLPPIPYAARLYPSSGPLVLTLLPELGHARQLARMNAARMFLAAQAGDEAQRLAAFQEVLASARLIGSQTTLIDNLVAVAINALACSELRKEITEKPLSEQIALDLLAAMDSHKLPSAAGSFDGERFSTLDMIQRTYSDNGSGDGRFLPSAAASLGEELGSPIGGPGVTSGGSRAFNVLGLIQPSRRETEDKTNEIYDYFVKLSSMTRTERSALTGPEPTSGLDRFKILELMVPAVGKALESNDQIASELAATRIMLALEIYRARTGSYPDSLAALAPSLLPALPLDSVNDKPFGYRLLDAAADPHRRSYLLYSCGPDGVDNQGYTGDPGDRHPVTPFRATGPLDFVYNLPRPLPEAPDPDAPSVPPTAAEDAANQNVELSPAPAPEEN